VRLHRNFLILVAIAIQMIFAELEHGVKAEAESDL
jgi:hypothetical protein